MTLRVVHVASGREWRGGQRQTWLLARELARRDDVAQVVVTGRDSELARRLEADGVPVHAVRWTAGIDPRAIRAALRELRRGPALLHAHDAHAVAVAGFASAWTRAPFVVTRRTVFPLRRPGFWARACRVLAISGAVRDALVAGGVDPARIEVVPSALDLRAVCAAEPAPLRARFGIPDHAPVVVSVAAWTAEKDPATLVAAAALARPLLPDLHWVLAGEGPLRDLLERRIAETSLGDRVHLAETPPEAASVIAAGDLFALASTSEGLGSAALAALARGVPVVATRVGGLAELLDGGAGELVPPGDPEAFAAAVAGVLQDGQRRARMVQAGRRRAAAHDLPSMADRVVRVYRSCASGA